MTCWVTVGDTLGNKQALVDTLADTVPEMEEFSVWDTRDGAKTLVSARADTLAEVEAVNPGDKLGDLHALNDLLGDSLRHIGQCAGTARHATWLATRDGGVLSI